MIRLRSGCMSLFACRLKYVTFAAVFAIPEYAWAVIVVEDRQTIDASNPPSAYQIQGNGWLIANGASTFAISVDAASRLELNDSSVDSATNVEAINTAGPYTVISRSIVTGSSRALVVGSGAVATASVQDSTLSGLQIAVFINTGGRLALENTRIEARSPDVGVGLITQGDVMVKGGSITGASAGMILSPSVSGPSVRNIMLDNAEINGLNGPAMQASPSSVSDLMITGGTRLNAGNGTLLQASDSSVTMTVDGSSLSGNIDATEASTVSVTLQNQAVLTGQLKNVDALVVDSGAEWNMTGNGAVGSLSVNNGRIRFGDAGSFRQLSLGTLSGSGTFLMNADFSTGQHDYLTVAGEATGSHTLLITSRGADPVADTEIPVVHIGGGDAQFSLLGGPVDLGAFSYDLSQRGTDWYLDSTVKVISPAARSVLALFNTAPTVWYGELTTLRIRMGELRHDARKAGGWVRTYGNRYDVSASSGMGYRQTQQGVSLGADAPLPVGDGHWLVGVLGGYSKSALDLERGSSGEVASYYLGAYTTWMDADSGYYVDGVIKVNRFKNESKVRVSDGTRAKGDYDNNGVGASLEVGRHIRLNGGYFIEPYTQLAGVVIQGKDYNLDNDLAADGDRTRSLLGKVGATLGVDLDMGNGRRVQPYVRAAYAHEFADNNQVRVNQNLFNNDLSGSRGEFGAGLAIQLADRLQAHLDLDYGKGDRIEQPWGANVGVRYSW